MVKEGAQLIVDGFEIGGGIGLSFGVCQLPDRVLPIHHILGGDFRQFPLSKIRQDFLLDDTLFCQPGVQLQLGLHVLLIELGEALKGHVHIGLLLHQELPLPRLGLLFGGKATLQLLLALSLPVRIAELDVPSAVGLVLKRRHRLITPFTLTPCAIKFFVEEFAVDPA